MPKFFVKDNQINGKNIIIENEDVNHIINVLRMKVGDKLQVCNSDTEKNYIAVIDYYQKECVKCVIDKELIPTTESNIDITIFQGLPKFDKMELIIQKATEIGVREIVPVSMKRSIVKLNEKDRKKKIDRWKKIAEIASKQSMRDYIPVVTNLESLLEVINNRLSKFDLVLLAYEKEKKNTLKNELIKIKQTKIDLNSDAKQKIRIAIIIGPEGGIDESEIERLQRLPNLRIVTLGNRILRTETAGLVMASNILYELEN